jgi:biotin transporter BioY
MDTVSIFAIGCLVLALAAGFIGAVLGSYQLFLVGSIVAIISAITIFIVVAIETRQGR